MRVLAAEYLMALMEALPSLTLEDLRYIPFEVADAFVAATSVRRRLAIQDGAVANAASATSIHQLDSEIQTIRTGVEEYREIAQRDMVKDILDSKYGRPVVAATEMGLAAIGLVRKEE